MLLKRESSRWRMPGARITGLRDDNDEPRPSDNLSRKRQPWQMEDRRPMSEDRHARPSGSTPEAVRAALVAMVKDARSRLG